MGARRCGCRFKPFECFVGFFGMNRFPTLESFADQCWRLLLNGSLKKNDPLRTPVIGTAFENTAHLRTVVLRKVDIAKRTLLFQTDIRSAKMTHLQQNPQLTCLFYHPKKQLQIIMKGTVELHHQDELAKMYWDRIPVQGRKTYAALQAPGTPVGTATDGLPDFWNNEMTLSETEYAFANFMVMVCQVEKMEALLLHPEGHQRAAFTYVKDVWESTWLIP